MMWLIDTDTWEPPHVNGNSDYLWLERYTLALFYEKTKGDSWEEIPRKSWLSHKHVCNWHGIVCPEIFFCMGARFVTGMSLETFNLQGTIPSEIGSLNDLTDVDFSCNQLEGFIPSQIFNLNSLERLDLGGNDLSGSIPSEVGNCRSLRSFNVGYNQLTGTIPLEIVNLSDTIGIGTRSGYNKLAGSIPSENKLSDLYSRSVAITPVHLVLKPNMFSNNDTPPSICNMILRNDSLAGCPGEVDLSSECPGTV